jgi:hypothetical protein
VNPVLGVRTAQVVGQVQNLAVSPDIRALVSSWSG